MKLHIPDFSQARVLVAGDLMLDRYWHGSTSRISPEAPVPVVNVGEIEERPGGAGNVALNIVTLKGSAELLGVTGDDEPADVLQRRLEHEKVECHFTRVKAVPTITKLRVISRHQQLIRMDFEDALHGQGQSEFTAAYQARLADCNAVVLSDYAKGTLHSVHELIKLARDAGKAVFIDPKGSDFARYSGATLLTPNLSEFEEVVGRCQSDEELVMKGESLRDKLNLEALLVTRSERGMTLLQKGQDALHLPALAREVFDVTGAGDTVISVLAAAFASGQSLAEATALANLAAGVVVGKLGTATVTTQELSRAMRAEEELERGVMSEDQLAAVIQEAKAHGEKVVMTNGCFDLLHAGHVTYLQQAAKLGDRLIVAVNDDASVKRLKGDERPVNTMDRRAHVLAALESVDWVVPFYEDTPTRLICRLQPDILVKGGDNDPDNIPGGDCVREAGGQVMVMEYVDNCSTTGLIRQIRTIEKNTPPES